MGEANRRGSYLHRVCEGIEKRRAEEKAQLAAEDRQKELRRLEWRRLTPEQRAKRVELAAMLAVLGIVSIDA